MKAAAASVEPDGASETIGEPPFQRKATAAAVAGSHTPCPRTFAPMSSKGNALNVLASSQRRGH